MLALFILFSVSPARALDANGLDQLIRNLDSEFRSSNRFIPALDLFSETYQKTRAEERRELQHVSRPELLASLRRLQPSLKINAGVAENLIKLHQFTQLCKEQMPLTPTLEQQRCDRVTADGVTGLPQKELDRLVAGFPARTEARADEWNYNYHELMKIALREGTDIDWYKFKMAAVIYKYGFHKTKRVTYNMFSRGKENRSYYVAGGTSLAIDALRNFHFGEREIQYIENHPQFSGGRVPKEFFDYLRAWRFKGNVRAVPDGTIVFPNEPIMSIETDPLSATLIECLLSPVIDTVTTSATKVARIVRAANGGPVVEGGTRRSGHALLGAYGALIGGAIGTSNTKLSRLLNTTPYGSMEHALFGLFKNAMRTFIGYNETFPNSTLLIDETEILDGVREAIRTAGPGLGGVRTDSEMADIGIGGTTLRMREMFQDFDYLDTKILISNRINEFTLDALKPGESAHQQVLVGTEAQTPSDANGSNIVYKLVEVKDLDTGAVRSVAKQSVGKPGIPGQTDVFRVTKPVDPESRAANPPQRAVYDVIGIRGESIELGTPLLMPGLNEADERLFPHESMVRSAERVRAQQDLFAPEILDIHAKMGTYPVSLSPLLRQKQETFARTKLAHDYRVGVQIGSFDPITDAHVRIAQRSRQLYRFNRMIAVPANQKPIHDKNYTFTSEERVAGMRRLLEPLGIEVDDREIQGGSRYTFDTLKAVRDEVRLDHPQAKVYVVIGSDVFKALTDVGEAGKWKRDQFALLNEGFNWVVHKRGDETSLDIPPSLLGPDWERLSKHHYENARTGAVIELVDVKIGANISSTRERELAAGVDTIFHGVDLQWTFWESVNGREAGVLAAPGSAAILQNVIKLTERARQSKRVKSVLTKDSHTQLEVDNAKKWNLEFDPDDGPGFPPHGMADRAGAVGDEILWEVKSVFPAEKQLIVPHNRHVRGVVKEMDRLELAPFPMSQFAHAIVSPEVQLLLHKNGNGSYDFGANPRAREIVDKIRPKHVYIYGVATDFCVYNAAMTYLNWGYEVSLVTDAIAGIYQEGIQEKLRLMSDAGVRMVTTAEVLEEYPAEALAPAATCEGGLQ